MARERSRVLATLVTYKPHPATLRDALAAAAREAEHVLVIDNRSTDESRSVIRDGRAAAAGSPERLERIEVVPHARNEGVAVAFNRGVDRALEGGFDFLFLLDQDSVARPGCVGTLLAEYRTLSERFRVGALQAWNVEPGGRVPLDARRRDYYARRGLYSGPSSYQGLLLLNSGTLIPTDVVRSVGRFDERYFVDFVDYEFALRLARFGYQVFHVPEAKVEHNVTPGDRPSPRRIYYAIRELVHLLGSYGRSFPGGVAPVAWTTLSRVGSLVVRSGHPLGILSLASRGAFDGVAGVTGELAPSL